MQLAWNMCPHGSNFTMHPSFNPSKQMLHTCDEASSFAAAGFLISCFEELCLPEEEVTEDWERGVASG